MDYYDETAASYIPLHGAEQREKINIIGNRLKPHTNDILLDVGCGTLLSAEILPCVVVGVDSSFAMLQQRKKGFGIQAYGEYLPFKSHTFDFVICVTALHNFNDYAKGLEEMLRVGKKSYAFSILKKSAHFEAIKKNVSNLFTITYTTGTQHDAVFFCEPKR